MSPRLLAASLFAWVFTSALAFALAPGLARAGEPPARNLLIEWRVEGRLSQQQGQSGIQRGRIVIDSRHGVVGRVGLGHGTVQTESDSASVQQVMVLNGGRARLYMGRSLSVTRWQWAWAAPSPSFQAQPMPGNQAYGGVTVWPQTEWVDLGQGLMVTPRWPGGRAPVRVELEAQSSEGLQGGSRLDPDGQTRRTELMSTLSVPLGEWTVVARNGGRTQQSQSGTLSTRDLDESESQQLSIRVTAP